MAPAMAIRRTEEPEIKETLRKETDAAVERGVFGIPTMIVRDELFWGLDQLRYVELLLEGKDPLTKLNLEDLTSNQGPSAWRRGVTRRTD